MVGHIAVKPGLKNCFRRNNESWIKNQSSWNREIFEYFFFFFFLTGYAFVFFQDMWGVLRTRVYEE